MSSSSIPTIDLSPFFSSNDEAAGDGVSFEIEKGKKEVMEMLTRACSEYGFFQIVNHGVPLDLLTRAFELSKTFFDYPEDEKLRSRAGSAAPLPAGYKKQTNQEYLLAFPPGSAFNIYPQNPPELKEVMEQVFSYLVKTGVLLESILSECLGLPANFLREYNDDRSWDSMLSLRYFPVTPSENYGIDEHEDGNCFTFVFQDEVGGLEFLKDGEWIRVVPERGTLVVNLGDVIQVLSNNRFKSGKHRELRPEGRSRYSVSFIYNLQGDKWVEPLPQFTRDIGERPKYRGFLYKEYLALRIRNKTHPPSRPEDVINITHYSIPS